MRKSILMVSLCVSISVMAQDKKVAMLETVGMTADISTMVKSMVRGELTKSISLEDGFSAFSRTDIDQMMSEMNFQASGMVSDEQIAKLGEMSGADYVCISKVSKDGQSYYIEASLINIESGKIENPATAFVEGGGMSAVNGACLNIAKELIGKTHNQQPSKTILAKSKTKIGLYEIPLAPLYQQRVLNLGKLKTQFIKTLNARYICSIVNKNTSKDFAKGKKYRDTYDSMIAYQIYSSKTGKKEYKYHIKLIISTYNSGWDVNFAIPRGSTFIIDIDVNSNEYPTDDIIDSTINSCMEKILLLVN